jgi:menaquinone-specific isochorismate synthase
LWIKLGAQLYSVINLPTSGKQDFSSIEKELFAIINGKIFEFGQSSADQSEEEYDSEKWNSKVTAALEAINNAGLDKVVLARYTKRRIPSPLDFKTIVAGLESEFPDCYTFAIFSKNSCFFGSTPERLIRISGCNLETEALAGSTKRGSFEEEDLQLEKELIANEKEINEHKSVLGYLVENLKEFSNEIIFSDKPAVKKLKNIQHLWTPVVAKLKGNNSPLRIASKLFPTPAVCGSPKEKALELIARLEEFDRGMYAGTVGWYNHFGRAEFAVTIRSGLIKNNYLYAFAGCGIVAGSESYKEFQESELKLKPILSRFRDETISQP